MPTGFNFKQALNPGGTCGDLTDSTPIDVPMTAPRRFFHLKQQLTGAPSIARHLETFA